MTDRHAGYIVVLDKDVRDDDAEYIINAIRMIKGVQGVTPYISHPQVHIAEMRARTAIQQRVLEALRE